MQDLHCKYSVVKLNGKKKSELIQNRQPEAFRSQSIIVDKTRNIVLKLIKKTLEANSNFSQNVTKRFETPHHWWQLVVNGMSLFPGDLNRAFFIRKFFYSY